MIQCCACYREFEHKKTIALVLSFAVADMLLFPRVSFPFSLPISIFPVLFLCFTKKLDIKSTLVFLIILICLMLSVFNSVILYGNEYFQDNSKRALQLVTVLSYHFVFINNRINKKQILFILRVFFVWVAFMAFWFWVDPIGQMQFQNIIYPESMGIHESNLAGMRFSYSFQDPNSAGYLVAMALAVYLIIEKSVLLKGGLTTLAIVVTLATQSRGAMISVAILLLAYAVLADKKGFLLRVFFAVLLCAFFSFVLVSTQYLTIISDLFNARAGLEDSLGGGRLSKYIYFISNMNFLPFGVGYNLEVNHLKFRPHSDVIRLVLSYGLLVFSFMVYKCRPRCVEHIFLMIPFVIGFLINTIIDDYRLFGFFLLGLVVLSQEKNKLHAKNMS
ncbi:O-antigen ligase family protein [Thermodesulfobacteriota bacterium]